MRQMNPKVRPQERSYKWGLPVSGMECAPTEWPVKECPTSACSMCALQVRVCPLQAGMLKGSR